MTVKLPFTLQERKTLLQQLTEKRDELGKKGRRGWLTAVVTVPLRYLPLNVFGLNVLLQQGKLLAAESLFVPLGAGVKAVQDAIDSGHRSKTKGQHRGRYSSHKKQQVHNREQGQHEQYREQDGPYGPTLPSAAIQQQFPSPETYKKQDKA
jgi:hypothetical protein